MRDLTVFTFSPIWGLPSAGPFALKLLKWLDLSGLPYRQVMEDNSRKGPKGKNPWIELDGNRIADTEIIIDLLARESGFDIDRGLSAEQAAQSHTARRMLEEHLHMVFEWEMFVHPNGAAAAHKLIEPAVPSLAVGPVTNLFKSHMRRQLYARGLARHEDAIIARKGKADVDAFETVLADRRYLLGDRLCMADVSAYGLMMPMAKWPMRTPVADYIKSRPRLLAYLERLAAAKAAQRLAA